MQSRSEAEIWEEFLASEGWALYVKHIQAEWGNEGTKFIQEMRDALNIHDNNAAASQARQVWSGRDTILGLTRWPADRMAQLKRKADLTQQYDDRRPPMPLALSGERRGA